MLLIQAFSITIAAGMIMNAYISYRNKRLGVYGLMFWWGIWVSLVFVSLLPIDEWYMQRVTGITTFNTALVVVIIVLFAFIYRLSVQMHKLSGKVTEIARAMAINGEKPKKTVKRRSGAEQH